MKSTNQIKPVVIQLDFEKDVNTNSVGYYIDLLIRSNLKNWEGKEYFFNSNSLIEIANQKVIDSFQANKVRNAMITKINKIVHKGPPFHFRNYHNY